MVPRTGGQSRQGDVESVLAIVGLKCDETVPGHAGPVLIGNFR